MKWPHVVSAVDSARTMLDSMTFSIARISLDGCSPMDLQYKELLFILLRGFRYLARGGKFRKNQNPSLPNDLKEDLEMTKGLSKRETEIS